MPLEDHLTKIGIFNKRDHKTYKIAGTSFVYFPNGRWLHGNRGSFNSERRWWKRCDDRILRPVSIDTVLAELPPEIQDTMIWNLNKFKD